MIKRRNKKTTNVAETLREQQDKLRDLDELLFDSEDIDDKVRSLWIEIYTNANDDRERISILYTDIFREMKGSPQGHAVYGPLVTKYLEKMAKANDQLLKLSEQIISFKHSNDTDIDPDDLLNSINTQQNDTMEDGS